MRSKIIIDYQDGTQETWRGNLIIEENAFIQIILEEGIKTIPWSIIKSVLEVD